MFGIAGLLLGFMISGARGYLVAGGFLYLGLWLYGTFVDQGKSLNFLPLNDADNWLHLAIALGMITLGVVFGRAPTPIVDVDPLHRTKPARAEETRPH